MNAPSRTVARCFAVALAAAAIALVGLSQASAATLNILEFAGAHGAVIPGDNAQEFDIVLGTVTLSDDVIGVGLAIDPITVDVTDFDTNPGTIDLTPLTISGFDDGKTAILMPTGEKLTTVGPFFGIGAGVIQAAVSEIVLPDGPLAIGGQSVSLSISAFVLTFQGAVVQTNGADPGTVTFGPLSTASVTAVPEPASATLGLVAALGLVGYCRRRRRSS